MTKEPSTSSVRTLTDIIYEREVEINRLRHRLNTLGIPYEDPEIHKWVHFRLGFVAGLITAAIIFLLGYIILS